MRLDFVLTIDPRGGQRYSSHYTAAAAALAAFWVDVKADCPNEATLAAAAAAIARAYFGRSINGSSAEMIEQIDAAFPGPAPLAILRYDFRTGDRISLVGMLRD